MVIRSNLRRILRLEGYYWVPLFDWPIYTNLGQIVETSLVSKLFDSSLSKLFDSKLWSELTEGASNEQSWKFAAP
jgi:hypothetical protein